MDWWVELDGDAEKFGIREEPGWTGAFTRAQAPEALYSNGSRVKKTGSKPGDTHKDGAFATVLGSLCAPGVGCLYFVEFDAHPRRAVAVAYYRLTKW